MKTLLVALSVMFLLAPTAQAQLPFDNYPNAIGVYTTPTPAVCADVILEVPTFGLYTMYLVVSNPVDENTGMPITTIGGYELSMAGPAGFDLHSVTYPAGCTFIGLPENPPFSVSCDIPVTGMSTVLAELTFLTFALDIAGGIFLSPFSEGTPSIPGHMAITNADNGYALSRAYPITGSYSIPVAVINMDTDCRAIPTDRTTWSAVKSMYR